ncbi:MAG TPA: TetR family transcriptional regulator [Microbacterium sp.]|uniref:TetR/AcrR family transcriptional regulator n=1 Tax=Microbacterium sp. TaxID=51671 RepID=UPI002CAFB5BE|nr:TetR family transcriptional regulator [Microbacterium sp.]HWI31791.1 TetR family transcriptional regulator [Microbacterium sp.]
MNQRDKLLAGALQCLREKGYAATTARDIAAASGANLASIGYHFGSKDALMSLASLQGVSDWGDAVAEAAAAIPDLDTPALRVAAFLSGLRADFPAARPVLSGLVESHARAQFDPDIREALAANAREGHQLLAAVALGIPYDAVTDAEAATVGVTYYALIAGFVLQELIAPQSTPDAPDVVNALALVAAS